MKEKFHFKSLRAKILTGFMGVVILVAILGTYNFYTIGQTNEEVESIINDQLPQLIAKEKLTINMAQRTALARGYLLSGDEEYKTRLASYTAESVEIEQTLLAGSASSELDTLIDQNNQWEQLIQTEVFSAFEAGDEEEARQILSSSAAPLSSEIMTGYENMALDTEASIIAAGEGTLNDGRSLMTISTIITLLVLLSSLTIGFLIARSISKPVQAVMHYMKGIAQGDLTQPPLSAIARDEIGTLMQASNQMNHHMMQLLTTIKAMSTNVSDQSQNLTHSSSEIKAGSQQVAVTMEELASGAETQAKSASSIAASMGDFTSMVAEAHIKGEDVQKASDHILVIAGEGRELMDTSVEQMKKIDGIVKQAAIKVEGLDQQSQEISELVSVINDIANQTNLLALNAAIEAARAGEQGRGFAVVADEVRKLSEQVSASVADITTIVGDIQSESSAVADSLQEGYKEVEMGTSQIQTTGDTFDTINTALEEMAESFQTVTKNLATISSGSQEINASVEEIASISEESAAGVEQTAASVQQISSSMEELSHHSEDLNNVSRQLNAEVDKFKI